MGGAAGLPQIDIGDGQRAAGGDVAGDDAYLLCLRTGADAADLRPFPTRRSSDLDQLAGAAVAGHGGEGVGDRLAGAELLDRGLAVVGAVGPVAREVGRAHV